jgi:pyrimidine operon attenuation protein/uracil phosphoribosyltransferase
MSTEVEKEIAALMAQCESALTEYSNRTGALMFSEAKKTPSTAVKTQAVSEQALEQITKTLELSLLDMSERAAKVAAKLASKANDLEALKLQRKTLETETETEAEAEAEAEAALGQGKSSSESIIQGENVVLKKVTFGNHRRS